MHNTFMKAGRYRRFFIKITAGILCLCLLAMDAGAAPALQSAHSAQSFKLPRSLGRVDAFHQGTSNKTLIYIQDAHDSLEAQENIARIIRHAVQHAGVKTVFEEGYEGPVPTQEHYGALTDPAEREKVSYYLLDQLRIGGAEYASINQNNFKLIGADAIHQHLDNVRWFQESTREQAGALQDLDLLLREYQHLADKHFSRATKEYLKLKQRFETHELDLLNFLKRARPFAATGSVYPTVDLLLRADRADRPAIRKRIESVSPYQLFRELERMDADIAENLFQVSEPTIGALPNGRHELPLQQKQIFNALKHLGLLNRLLKFEIAPAEFQAIKGALEIFNTQALAQFLVKETQRSAAFSKQWELAAHSAVKFYEAALKREEAVASSLDQFLNKSGEQTAVLVFGGFHRQGLESLLARSGASYYVVTPSMKSSDLKHRALYKELMRQGYALNPMGVNNVARAARLPSELEMVRTGGPAARAELADYHAAIQKAVREVTRSLGAGNFPRDYFSAQVERRLQGRSEMRTDKTETGDETNRQSAQIWDVWISLQAKAMRLAETSDQNLGSTQVELSQLTAEYNAALRLAIPAKGDEKGFHALTQRTRQSLEKVKQRLAGHYGQTILLPAILAAAVGTVAGAAVALALQVREARTQMFFMLAGEILGAAIALTIALIRHALSKKHAQEIAAGTKSLTPSDASRSLLFSEEDLDRIKERGEIFKQIYPKLDDEGKQILLYPSLLLAFMGAKPAYIRTTEDPDHLALVMKIESLPEADNLPLSAAPYVLYDLLLAISAIYEHEEFLVEQGVLKLPEDRALLESIFQAHRAGDEDAMVAAAERLMRTVLERADQAGEHSPVEVALTGVLMAYPEQNIRDAIRNKDLIVVDTEFDDVGIIMKRNADNHVSGETEQYLMRMQQTLAYAYSLLGEQPNFTTMAKTLRLPRDMLSLKPEDTLIGRRLNDRRSEMRTEDSSAYIQKKIREIQTHEQELKRFLGVTQIKGMSHKVVRDEDGSGGTVLQFDVDTEQGKQSFFAKLRHSSGGDGLDELVKDDWAPKKITVTQADPSGDWIKFKVEGIDHEFKNYRSNPTSLEYQFTLKASKAGVTPPSAIIADTLLIQGIRDGVSLEVLPNTDWVQFFLDNEQYFITEIGRQYGRLNKLAGVYQVDIKLAHIFITRDKKVYLIDFSTRGDEGILSAPEGVYVKTIDFEYVQTTLRTWLDPFLGLGNYLRLLDKDKKDRKETYSGYFRKGYNSISPEVGRSEMRALDPDEEKASEDLPGYIRWVIDKTFSGALPGWGVFLGITTAGLLFGERRLWPLSFLGAAILGLLFWAGFRIFRDTTILLDREELDQHVLVQKISNIENQIIFHVGRHDHRLRNLQRGPLTAMISRILRALDVSPAQITKIDLFTSRDDTQTIFEKQPWESQAAFEDLAVLAMSSADMDEHWPAVGSQIFVRYQKELPRSEMRTSTLTAGELVRLAPSFSSAEAFFSQIKEWEAANPDAKILTLVRHGESMSNLFHYSQSYDSFSPLTRRGKNQAKALAAFFKRLGVNFDHTVASSLERALDTLIMLANQNGSKLKKLQRFREILLNPIGEIPMHILSEIDPQLWNRFIENPEIFYLPGGQFSGQKFKEYFLKFIREDFLQKSGRRTVVASHGMTILLALMYLLDIPREKYNDFWPRLGNPTHAGITVLAYHPGREQPWEFLVKSDDTYMAESLRGKTTGRMAIFFEGIRFYLLALVRWAQKRFVNPGDWPDDYFSKWRTFFAMNKREAMQTLKDYWERSSGPVGIFDLDWRVDDEARKIDAGQHPEIRVIYETRFGKTQEVGRASAGPVYGLGRRVRQKIREVERFPEKSHASPWIFSVTHHDGVVVVKKSKKESRSEMRPLTRLQIAIQTGFMLSTVPPTAAGAFIGITIANLFKMTWLGWVLWTLGGSFWGYVIGLMTLAVMFIHQLPAAWQEPLRLETLRLESEIRSRLERAQEVLTEALKPLAGREITVAALTAQIKPVEQKINLLLEELNDLGKQHDLLQGDISGHSLSGADTADVCNHCLGMSEVFEAATQAVGLSSQKILLEKKIEGSTYQHLYSVVQGKEGGIAVDLTRRQFFKWKDQPPGIAIEPAEDYARRLNQFMQESDWPHLPLGLWALWREFEKFLTLRRRAIFNLLSQPSAQLARSEMHRERSPGTSVNSTASRSEMRAYFDETKRQEVRILLRAKRVIADPLKAYLVERGYRDSNIDILAPTSKKNPPRPLEDYHIKISQDRIPAAGWDQWLDALEKLLPILILEFATAESVEQARQDQESLRARQNPRTVRGQELRDKLEELKQRRKQAELEYQTAKTDADRVHERTSKIRERIHRSRLWLAYYSFVLFLRGHTFAGISLAGLMSAYGLLVTAKLFFHFWGHPYGLIWSALAAIVIGGVFEDFVYTVLSGFKKSQNDAGEESGKEEPEDNSGFLEYLLQYGLVALLAPPFILAANFFWGDGIVVNIGRGFNHFFDWGFHYILGGLLVYSLIDHLIKKYRGEPQSESDGIRLINDGAAVLIAPVSEEVWFRYLWFNLSQWWWVGWVGFSHPFNFTLPLTGLSVGFGLPTGVFIAMMANGDLFFRAHGNRKWFHHWFMGVIASYAYYQSNSLIVSITIHFLWNLIAVLFDRALNRLLPLPSKAASNEDARPSSEPNARSEMRSNSNESPYEVLRTLLQNVPPTRQVRGDDDEWEYIAVYDQGELGKELISIQRVSLTSPLNKGRYVIAVGDTITASIDPDGTVKDEGDFAELMDAIKLGLSQPETVQAYVRGHLAADARDVEEVILVRSRWPAGKYEEQQARLTALEKSNAGLQGIEKTKLSLALFLRTVNILYESFGKGENTVKALADIGGRYGSESIRPLFSYAGSPETDLLNVSAYQQLGGNHLEFLKNQTLELVDDPQDSERVRFILRPRHPGQLPLAENYYEFYNRLVQAGIPVTYDDPDEDLQRNQFSRIFLGDYNAKYDERDSKKYPLFASAKSEMRVEADRMSFSAEKEFRRENTRPDYPKNLPWGYAHVTAERGVSVVIEGLNALPFLYTSGWSHSGLPSDHAQDVLDERLWREAQPFLDSARGLRPETRRYTHGSHSAFISFRADYQNQEYLKFEQTLRSLPGVEVVDSPVSGPYGLEKMIRITVPESIVRQNQEKPYEDYLKTHWDTVLNAVTLMRVPFDTQPEVLIRGRDFEAEEAVGNVLARVTKHLDLAHLAWRFEKDAERRDGRPLTDTELENFVKFSVSNDQTGWPMAYWLGDDPPEKKAEIERKLEGATRALEKRVLTADERSEILKLAAQTTLSAPLSEKIAAIFDEILAPGFSLPSEKLISLLRDLNALTQPKGFVIIIDDPVTGVDETLTPGSTFLVRPVPVILNVSIQGSAIPAVLLDKEASTQSSALGVTLNAAEFYAGAREVYTWLNSRQAGNRIIRKLMRRDLSAVFRFKNRARRLEELAWRFFETAYAEELLHEVHKLTDYRADDVPTAESERVTKMGVAAIVSCPFFAFGFEYALAAKWFHSSYKDSDDERLFARLKSATDGGYGFGVLTLILDVAARLGSHAGETMLKTLLRLSGDKNGVLTLSFLDRQEAMQALTIPADDIARVVARSSRRRFQKTAASLYKQRTKSTLPPEIFQQVQRHIQSLRNAGARFTPQGLVFPARQRSEMRSISSYQLKDAFGAIGEGPVLTGGRDLDEDFLYEWSNGKKGRKIAERLPEARYVFRALDESGAVIPNRFIKITHHSGQNEALFQEAQALFKLQQEPAARGVPRLVRAGSMKNGGLWIEQEGIAPKRSLEREIFGSVPRLFDVLIHAGEIIRQVHERGLIHANIRPAAFLINDAHELQLIEFGNARAKQDSRDQSHTRNAYSALNQFGNFINTELAEDVDVYSFVLMIAEFLDQQMQSSPAGMQALFQRMRDDYLELIFEHWSFEHVQEILSQWDPDKVTPLPRAERPQSVAPVLEKLRRDLEIVQFFPDHQPEAALTALEARLQPPADANLERWLPQLTALLQKEFSKPDEETQAYQALLDDIQKNAPTAGETIANLLETKKVDTGVTADSYYKTLPLLQKAKPDAEIALRAVALYVVDRGLKPLLSKQEEQQLDTVLALYNQHPKTAWVLDIPSLFALSFKTFFKFSDDFKATSNQFKSLSYRLKNLSGENGVKAVALSLALHGVHLNAPTGDSDDDFWIIDRNLKFLIARLESGNLSEEARAMAEVGLLRIFIFLVPFLQKHKAPGGTIPVIDNLDEDIYRSLRDLVYRKREMIDSLSKKYYGWSWSDETPDAASAGFAIILYKNGTFGVDKFVREVLGKRVEVSLAKMLLDRRNGSFESQYPEVLQALSQEAIPGVFGPFYSRAKGQARFQDLRLALLDVNEEWRSVRRSEVRATPSALPTRPSSPPVRAEMRSENEDEAAKAAMLKKQQQFVELRNDWLDRQQSLRFLPIITWGVKVLAPLALPAVWFFVAVAWLMWLGKFPGRNLLLLEVLLWTAIGLFATIVSVLAPFIANEIKKRYARQDADNAVQVMTLRQELLADLGLSSAPHDFGEIVARILEHGEKNIYGYQRGLFLALKPELLRAVERYKAAINPSAQPVSVVLLPALVVPFDDLLIAAVRLKNAPPESVGHDAGALMRAMKHFNKALTRFTKARGRSEMRRERSPGASVNSAVPRSEMRSDEPETLMRPDEETSPEKSENLVVSALKEAWRHKLAATLWLASVLLVIKGAVRPAAWEAPLSLVFGIASVLVLALKPMRYLWHEHQFDKRIRSAFAWIESNARYSEMANYLRESMDLPVMNPDSIHIVFAPEENAERLLRSEKESVLMVDPAEKRAIMQINLFMGTVQINEKYAHEWDPRALAVLIFWAGALIRATREPDALPKAEAVAGDFFEMSMLHQGPVNNLYLRAAAYAKGFYDDLLRDGDPKPLQNQIGVFFTPHARSEMRTAVRLPRQKSRATLWQKLVSEAAQAETHDPRIVRVGVAPLTSQMNWVVRTLTSQGEQTFLVRLQKVYDLDGEYHPGDLISYDLFVAPLEDAEQLERGETRGDFYKGHAMLTFNAFGELLSWKRRQAITGWPILTRRSGLIGLEWIIPFLNNELDRWAGRSFRFKDTALHRTAQAALDDVRFYVHAEDHRQSTQGPGSTRQVLQTADESHHRIGTADVMFQWRNTKGRVFRGDRQGIYESVSEFLTNPDLFADMMRNIGHPVAQPDVARVKVEYLRTSERDVFRLQLGIRRADGQIEEQPLRISVKNVRTSNRRAVKAFKALRGTGLAPNFGGMIGDVYFEEWIDGQRVHDVAKDRPLMPDELREIAATWTRIGRKVSGAQNYSGFPSDMNPDNMLFRTDPAKGRLAAVDLYNVLKFTNPSIFVEQLVRIYVRGTGALKPGPDANNRFILEGVWEGFDGNRDEALDFMRTANRGRILSAPVRAQLQTFIEQSQRGRSEMRALDIEKMIGEKGEMAHFLRENFEFARQRGYNFFDEHNDFVPLPLEEQARLKQEGSEESKHILAVAHMLWILRIINRRRYMLGSVPKLELMAVGMQALKDSISPWKPERAQLNTYAGITVVRSLHTYVRREQSAGFSLQSYDQESRPSKAAEPVSEEVARELRQLDPYLNDLDKEILYLSFGLNGETLTEQEISARYRGYFSAQTIKTKRRELLTRLAELKEPGAKPTALSSAEKQHPYSLKTFRLVDNFLADPLRRPLLNQAQTEALRLRYGAGTGKILGFREIGPALGVTGEMARKYVSQGLDLILSDADVRWKTLLESMSVTEAALRQAYEKARQALWTNDSYEGFPDTPIFTAWVQELEKSYIPPYLAEIMAAQYNLRHPVEELDFFRYAIPGTAHAMHHLPSEHTELHELWDYIEQHEGLVSREELHDLPGADALAARQSAVRRSQTGFIPHVLPQTQLDELREIMRFLEGRNSNQHQYRLGVALESEVLAALRAAFPARKYPSDYFQSAGFATLLEDVNFNRRLQNRRGDSHRVLFAVVQDPILLSLRDLIGMLADTENPVAFRVTEKALELSYEELRGKFPGQSALFRLLNYNLAVTRGRPVWSSSADKAPKAEADPAPAVMQLSDTDLEAAYQKVYFAAKPASLATELPTFRKFTEPLLSGRSPLLSDAWERVRLYNAAHPAKLLHFKDLEQIGPEPTVENILAFVDAMGGLTSWQNIAEFFNQKNPAADLSGRSIKTILGEAAGHKTLQAERRAQPESLVPLIYDRPQFDKIRKVINAVENRGGLSSTTEAYRAMGHSSPASLELLFLGGDPRLTLSDLNLNHRRLNQSGTPSRLQLLFIDNRSLPLQRQLLAFRALPEFEGFLSTADFKAKVLGLKLETEITAVSLNVRANLLSEAEWEAIQDNRRVLGLLPVLHLQSARRLGAHAKLLKRLEQLGGVATRKDLAGGAPLATVEGHMANLESTFAVRNQYRRHKGLFDYEDIKLMGSLKQDVLMQLKAQGGSWAQAATGFVAQYRERFGSESGMDSYRNIAIPFMVKAVTGNKSPESLTLIDDARRVQVFKEIGKVAFDMAPADGALLANYFRVLVPRALNVTGLIQTPADLDNFRATLQRVWQQNAVPRSEMRNTASSNPAQAIQALAAELSGQLLNEDNYRRFLARHGFVHIQRGTYYSASKHIYFYNKGGTFSSETEAEAAAKRTIAEQLTQAGALHPGTQWGFFKTRPGYYALYAMTPELEAVRRGWIETGENPPRRNWQTFLRMRDFYPEREDILRWKYQLMVDPRSHVRQWVQKISPRFNPAASIPGQVTFTDISALFPKTGMAKYVDVSEALTALNWGWDRTTGKLYPLDVEVISFKNFKISKPRRPEVRKASKAKIENMSVPAAVFLDARELAMLPEAQITDQMTELMALLSRHRAFDIYVRGADRYPVETIQNTQWQKLLNGYRSRVHVGMLDRAGLQQKKILVQASFFKDQGTLQDTEKGLLKLKSEYQLEKEVTPLEYTQGGALKAFLNLAESLKPGDLIRKLNALYAVRAANGRLRMADVYLASVWADLKNSYVFQWSA